MAEFWLATFEFQPSTGAAGAAEAWAIEIIRDTDLDEYAVLLSKVDDALAPKVLRCHLGFANGAKACNIWRDRGFPLIDAIIDNHVDAGFRVRTACFLDANEIVYDAEVLSTPLKLFDSSNLGSPIDGLDTLYRQSQEAPDYAYPATFIKRRSVTWSPSRKDVRGVSPATFDLKVALARFPPLAPLKTEAVLPKAVWQGMIELPQWPPEFDRAAPEHARRVDEFGVPAFQFDDIEVLGFRLNLDELGFRDKEALLEKMVERLNFHLDPLDPEESRGSHLVRSPIPDFRYLPATNTLILELLRYGKMRAEQATPPLRDGDFQSQHELLVRMLVGRVDEDAAQARDPATFVPTIFVDNPWSKLLGRNLQGFDKWLADFCISADKDAEPLRPDGRKKPDGKNPEEPANVQPEELASIKQIRLVTNSGGPGDQVLMRLDCPYDTYENWNAFEPVDLDLAVGASPIESMRWRQDDFAEDEFRRSFARSAIPGTLKGFTSLQVSPVGQSDFLKKWKAETTLIRGTFSVVDTPQFVMPNGIVTLTLCSNARAPQAWKDLCTLFDIPEGGEGRISLTTGNWYRMRCSMKLTIQNSFDQ